MKLNLTRQLTALALVLALLHGTAMLRAEEATAKARVAEGTLKAVDIQGKTVTIEGMLGSLTARKFHLADGVAIVTGLERNTPLVELKPDMEVRLHYQRVNGVRVATRLEQQVHETTSYVKSVDLKERHLKVEKARLAHVFWITDDTRLAVHGKTAKLEDLKPGQRVTVSYVRSGMALMAKSVNDPTELFAGTIEAINVEKGSITLKNLLSRQTFTVGADCRIVVADMPKATLRDLRIGDRATVSYHDVQGVLIATRIAMDTDPQTASKTAENNAVTAR